MRRATIAAMAFTLALAISAASAEAGKAEERATEEAITIERVRWSGISLEGWRILGSWATVPAEPSTFGTPAPYFRLNGDDETVFRGLGRESGFAQRILPTLHSGKRLRAILSADERAGRSLAQFDSQVAKGEKVHMGGTALVAGGSAGIAAGVIMVFLGLGEATGAIEEETPAMMKAGYNVAIVGASLWLTGRICQLVGSVVTRQAFSHLSDAIDSFNRRKG